jgi:hypothetical protein
MKKAQYLTPAQAQQREAIRKMMRNRQAELKRPEKRIYPKVGTFQNTKEYVHLFYRMNSSLYDSYCWSREKKAPVENYVDDLFGPMSTNPITWPDLNTEVVIEHLESCPACGITL